MGQMPLLTGLVPANKKTQQICTKPLPLTSIFRKEHFNAKFAFLKDKQQPKPIQ
jgi:hypothetical protein